MKKLIVSLILLFSLFCASVCQSSEPMANGDTSRSICLVMKDRDGDPNTSITVTTLNFNYCLEGGSTVSGNCTDLGSENAAYSSLGCYEMSTSGLYRFCVPNAALAGGIGTITNVWITDDISGTRTSYLAIPLSMPVDVHKVSGADPTSKAAQATATVDEFETQSQLDPTGFHMNLMEVNGTAQTAGDIISDIAGISATVGTAKTTTVNAVTSTKVFTLTAGIQRNNAYRYHVISVQDATDSEWEVRLITKYVGSTRTVTLDKALTFTPVNGDVVEIQRISYFRFSGGW